jgi:hypothetical protein
MRQAIIVFYTVFLQLKTAANGTANEFFTGLAASGHDGYTDQTKAMQSEAP